MLFFDLLHATLIYTWSSGRLGEQCHPSKQVVELLRVHAELGVYRDTRVGSTFLPRSCQGFSQSVNLELCRFKPWLQVGRKSSGLGKTLLGLVQVHPESLAFFLSSVCPFLGFLSPKGALA